MATLWTSADAACATGGRATRDFAAGGVSIDTRSLQPGDALLVAGKGHETGQVIKGDIFPFDDVEQASIAVAALDGVI